MQQSARERIIEAGAAIMHRKGFQGTGLKEILDAAGSPKGSFYHYFPSKEAFALAVVEHFEQMLGRMRQEVEPREGGGALGRLSAFVDRFEAFQAEHGYRLGCPIGNLAQELAGQSGLLGERLGQSLGRLTVFFRDIVRDGQAASEIDPDLDPDEAAGFLTAAWQGALLRMKATRSGEPLAVFGRYAVRLLRRD